MKPPTDIRLVKNDAAVLGLEPGHHAYEIQVGGDVAVVVGVVASAPSSRGTMWTAGRIMPNRTQRFGAPLVWGTTRAQAVESFLRALP